jgi:hypothetical protein
MYELMWMEEQGGEYSGISSWHVSVFYQGAFLFACTFL